MVHISKELTSMEFVLQDGKEASDFLYKISNEVVVIKYSCNSSD